MLYGKRNVVELHTEASAQHDADPSALGMLVSEREDIRFYEGRATDSKLLDAIYASTPGEYT